MQEKAIRTIKFSFYALIFFLGAINLSRASMIFPLGNPPLSLSPPLLKKLKEGHKIIRIQVTEGENSSQQKLIFLSQALHPKACHSILKKLSRYENYSHYLDFIKESHYEEVSKRLTLQLESPYLPFSFILDFHLPRIEKPGVYPFQFVHGIFPGLKGLITITSSSQLDQRCLFSLEASWQGPSSGIPHKVIEFFTQVLVEKGIDKFFRASQF